MNLDLALKIREVIEDESKHDQRGYGVVLGPDGVAYVDGLLDDEFIPTEEACGTKHCIAGWAVVLAGGEYKQRRPGGPWQFFVDDRVVDAATYACEVLDIGSREAWFDPDPDDGFAGGIFDGILSHEQALRRFDKLIEQARAEQGNGDGNV